MCGGIQKNARQNKRVDRGLTFFVVLPIMEAAKRARMEEAPVLTAAQVRQMLQPILRDDELRGLVTGAQMIREEEKSIDFKSIDSFS